MRKNIEITDGPIGKNLLWFTIPIILSDLIQKFYNMADTVVVGRYAGAESLAAVGSTSALINLLINLFIGLSTGASVCVARYIGEGNHKALSKAVHTAIGVAVAGGTLIAVIGVLFSKQFLIWMDVPSNVLEEATLYMKIIFLGNPANLIYNFGAGILRAAGDSKRPMIFLTISGVVNVVLNLVLVICFRMGAAGVGVATVISQVISAGMVLWILFRKNNVFQLSLRKIRIHWKYLFEILKIGIPAGIQKMMYSISNVLIQSSVNSFGDVVVAGNSAAVNIGSLVFAVTGSIHQAMITFVGQNVGAGRRERLKKIMVTGCLQTMVITIGISGLLALFGRQLLELYVPGEEEVISYGLLRLQFMVPAYFIYGIMEVLVGSQRGMGNSFRTMIASILGICIFRVLWIYTVFARIPTLESLYISYPISWILTALGQLVLCRMTYKKTVQNR